MSDDSVHGVVDRALTMLAMGEGFVESVTVLTDRVERLEKEVAASEHRRVKNVLKRSEAAAFCGVGVTAFKELAAVHGLPTVHMFGQTERARYLYRVDDLESLLSYLAGVRYTGRGVRFPREGFEGVYGEGDGGAVTAEDEAAVAGALGGS